jgi:hypothetical protein
MNRPKSASVAKMEGQVFVNSRGDIWDIDIELCQMFNVAHVTPHTTELAKTLHCKFCMCCNCAHTKSTVTIFGDELDEGFVEPRNGFMVNIVSAGNEDSSELANEMLDINRSTVLSLP